MATPTKPKAPNHGHLARLAFSPHPAWPPTPQPSEQGTTPEELATIVAEETARAEALAIVTHPTHSKQQIQAERAMGEATRDQWEPACNCAAGQSAAPLWHLAGCPVELPPDD